MTRRPPGGIPPHVVRVHPRARRVRIRVTAHDGVVVTLPPHAPRRLAEDALASNAGWVRCALRRVEARRRLLEAPAEELIPATIEFAATGERWEVRRSVRDGRASARESAGVVRVAAPDASSALEALRRWLHRASRTRLVALAEAAAEEWGVAVAGVSVRAQRTRWGSRSARGTVSLNRNLVFLPESVCRSVILHEICHARHHDHSPAFWTALREMDPDMESSRRTLRRDASGLVPVWAARS